MEDKELIHRCKNGEKPAFEELISKYHPLVYKFLVRITDNEHLAEDLTQEVFIKVIRNIDKFDTGGKAKFSTYIITISKNSYIDYLRKKTRFLQKNIIEVDSFPEVAAPNFEELLIDRLYGKEVINQLENLTDEQQIVIKLKYIEGLTLKEIGEKLDLESKTVKSRIHNGITKLKKLLIGGSEKDDRGF